MTICDGGACVGGGGDGGGSRGARGDLLGHALLRRGFWLTSGLCKLTALVGIGIGSLKEPAGAVLSHTKQLPNLKWSRIHV